MSVVTISASIPSTKTRPGEPIESEKFRMRRLRIRQWEHEQALEDIAAVRMIQQIRDSSIFPSSSVKTEFSDLDGMTWESSAERARSLLDYWRARRASRPLPKSTSLTLPLCSREDNVTIVRSVTYDGLPASPTTATNAQPLTSPITPTPALSNIFTSTPTPTLGPDAQSQMISRGRKPGPVHIASCNNETIRPTFPPGLSSATAITPPVHHSSLSPVHYFHLARKQSDPNAPSTSLSLVPAAVTRPKRVRSHATMLPLKAQRDLTVRPGMYKARGGSTRGAAGLKMQREPGEMETVALERVGRPVMILDGQGDGL